MSIAVGCFVGREQGHKAQLQRRFGTGVCRMTDCLTFIALNYDGVRTSLRLYANSS